MVRAVQIPPQDVETHHLEGADLRHRDLRLLPPASSAIIVPSGLIAGLLTPAHHPGGENDSRRQEG